MGPLPRGAQGPPWRPWGAMVEARAVQTAVQGLGSRFHQTVSPRGAAGSPGWRAMAALGAVNDVVKARWLAGHDRFRLWPRLAWDAADLALWCMAARDDTDTSEDAVIPGASLATEAGARLGPAGLVVPLTTAAVAAAVRSRRGHRLRLEQFSWQLMGLVGGWAVRLAASRRKRRQDRAHAEELTARVQQAELAGLNDVIVEHEGAMDLLQRATALIDLSVPGARRRSLAGAVKAAVAETIRGRATYLGDAVATWQADHNIRRDLEGLVTVVLEPGAGTVLLSDTQAGALRERLEARTLSGTVTVQLVGAKPPGGSYGPLRLSVDGEELQLPGERSGTRWVFDATPVAFLLDVGWLAQPTGAQREAVPWSATAPSLLASLAAALWSARRAERNRSITPGAAVGASAAITLVYTVASTTTMRQPHTAGGVSRYPWVMALQGYELVRGISAEEMSARTRVAGWLGTAAIVTLGWTRSPRPRSRRALMAELGWVAGFDVFAHRLRRATREAGDRLAQIAAAEDADALAHAYNRGRQRAWDVVTSSLTAAERDLDSHRGAIPHDVGAEAGRRLGEVRRMLG